MSPTNSQRTDRIVVVDDDARIRDLLRRYLTQEGFEVLLAEDGKALNRILTRETVDMIVLDLMLPGEDGLSICRRLRAANDITPIIMLTAKVEDVDRIVGLEVGADDYMPKPFNPRELLARIHAVLRRRPLMEAPGAPAREPQTVTFGPFEFDLALRRLTRDGEVPWCAIRANLCRATSWPSWRVAENSNPSTAAWTSRCRACAR
jgi:two-component system phosphate regulon response regulator OmpR